MSRHNRRRHRGGRKLSSSRALDPDADPSADPGLFLSEPASDAPHQAPFGARLGQSSRANTARHWYNRWAAWQARERRQQQEARALEAEKRRLFGEDDGSGEDDALCARMLEYYGSLDFIDP